MPQLIYSTAFLFIGASKVLSMPEQEESFAVQGTISLTQFGEKNQPIARSSQSFQGEFKGALWWIRTAVIQKTEWLTADAMKTIGKLESSSKVARSKLADKPLAWETGTDGVDNYLIGIVGDWEASVDGRAFPGTVPFPDARTYDMPIWLAYASSSALRSNNTGRLPILWHCKGAPLFYLDYSVPVTATFDSEPPYFPVSILFRNEGVLFDTEPDLARIVIKTNRLSPPYHVGFNEAEYRLLAVTNLAGIRLPSEFEFTVFKPKRGGLTNVDLEKGRSYHARVASVIIPAPRRDSYAPDPKTLKPFIVDKRFVTADHNVPVRYVLTNGIWPTSTNKGLQEILNSARQSNSLRQARPSTSESSRRKAKFVIGLVVVITVAPAAFWISVERRKQSKIVRSEIH